jgi:hypothetical protein
LTEYGTVQKKEIKQVGDRPMRTANPLGRDWIGAFKRSSPEAFCADAAKDTERQNNNPWPRALIQSLWAFASHDFLPRHLRWPAKFYQLDFFGV